jgi:hypothetical protein
MVDTHNIHGLFDFTTRQLDNFTNTSLFTIITLDHYSFIKGSASPLLRLLISEFALRSL